MEKIEGIKYMKSGGRRYVRVDLDLYGNDELLQDFLDGLEVEAQQQETKGYVTLEEFMKKEYRRRGLKDETL